MKRRITVQLPEQLVERLEAAAEGIESRNSAIGLVTQEHQRHVGSIQSAVENVGLAARAVKDKSLTLESSADRLGQLAGGLRQLIGQLRY